MALDKAALGQRYICFECETKFYDLNRPDPTCPSCNADQRERPSTGAAAAAAPVAKPTPEEPAKDTAPDGEDVEAEIENLDLDDDDDEDLGLSELGAPETEEVEDAPE